MERGEVHCAERPKEASLNRRTMNIGKMGGDRVMDKKFLRVLRIMGKIMNQVLYEVTIFNVDSFIFMKGNIRILKLKRVPFTLQFVPTNVAFVKDGVINTTFA